jgi:PAS domain S-box-containing protein
VSAETSEAMKRDDASGPSGANWHATILDSVADGVFTVDESFRITSFNRAAETITGYARDEAIGRPCHEIFRADICKSHCALRHSFHTGSPLVNVRIHAINREGRSIPLSISTAILRSGRRAGGVETFRDLSTEEALRERVRANVEPPGVIGQHPRMRRIYESLPDVAASEATVLIEGPSGAGKGMLASTIHGMSARQDGPFVKTSCAALPENLLESELFGYRKGAFTDARQDKPGRIAAAHGGTLFLDEIGDVPLSVQVKLLRFLQDREYEPLGSNRAVRADVRIIAATNRGLAQLVKDGKFRADLFYRLKVVHFELPSLGERKDDIPLLASRFIARQNERTGKRLLGLTDDAIQCLRAHDYPGNVRELENAIEHAFVMCHEGFIQPKHLPPWVCACESNGGAEGDATSEPAEAGKGEPSLTAREAAQADVIRRTLERHHGNRIAAAKELGMHRATLWRWLRKVGERG